MTHILPLSSLILIYFLIVNLLTVSVWSSLHLNVVAWRWCKSKPLLRFVHAHGLVWNKYWSRKLIAIIYIVALPLFCLCFYFGGFMVNYTNSMPLGIYKMNGHNLKVGGLATYSLEDETLKALALERGYLKKTGLLAQKIQPIVKHIGGLPGDVVGFDNGLITINGQILPKTQCKAADSYGRQMPDSKLKVGTIPSGKVFLVSYHEGGFDGRYFGLVDIAKIKDVKPFLIFY